MIRQMKAVIECLGDGYVPLCPEVDITSQGATVGEVRENLTEALEVFSESARAREIRSRLQDEVYVGRLAVTLGQFASCFGPTSLRDTCRGSFLSNSDAGTATS